MNFRLEGVTNDYKMTDFFFVKHAGELHVISLIEGNYRNARSASLAEYNRAFLHHGLPTTFTLNSPIRCPQTGQKVESFGAGQAPNPSLLSCHA
jgi:hypothetical protein